MHNDWITNIAESVKAESVDVRNGLKWFFLFFYFPLFSLLAFVLRAMTTTCEYRLHLSLVVEPSSISLASMAV